MQGLILTYYSTSGQKFEEALRLLKGGLQSRALAVNYDYREVPPKSGDINKTNNLNSIASYWLLNLVLNLTFGSSIPLTTGLGRSRTKNAAKFAV